MGAPAGVQGPSKAEDARPTGGGARQAAAPRTSLSGPELGQAGPHPIAGAAAAAADVMGAGRRLDWGASAADAAPRAGGLKDPDAAAGEVVRHAQLVQREGGALELRLRLEPDHLGEVSLRLVSREGRVEAEVLVSSHQARQAFEAELPRLRESLAQQGVTLGECSVDVGGRAASRGSPDGVPVLSRPPGWTGPRERDPAPEGGAAALRPWSRWLLPESSFEYVV
ncbi:MAG: flagellar hook-length control protein FliK [Acetobacteraceae bacterium]|nr:flagellar hook-length control protein FliK [Acetobacteraceae bacterium]